MNCFKTFFTLIMSTENWEICGMIHKCVDELHKILILNALNSYLGNLMSRNRELRW